MRAHSPESSNGETTAPAPVPTPAPSVPLGSDMAKSLIALSSGGGFGDPDDPIGDPGLPGGLRAASRFAPLSFEGPERPLRVVHVGPSLMRAGVEVWLKGLARFLNPERLVFTRCLATHPEFFDPEFAAELPMPCEVAGRESVRRAVAESDVLMFWGPGEMGGWLKDHPPRLGLFVAHGEGEYTRRMLEACRPVVDHVVAVSRRVRERVAADFPSTVIPNGVDLAHLCRSLPRDESRARFGFGPDDFVIGYVGRFSDEKRAHRLIEAVAELPPRFKVLLVGWGPLHSRLLELANQRVPGRFAFTLGKDCFGDYYEAIDALGMVSAEEGCPMVALEAMLCGRPVIATEVGAVPELIVDRVNGLVVSGTVASIRDAILLLDHHPEWARGLAAEAKRTIDRQGHARRMARDYENLIHRLWRAKPARRNGKAKAHRQPASRLRG